MVPNRVSQRDPGLDALRGLAILLVMFFHFTIVRDAPDNVRGSFLNAALMGWCGVDLFFVLSGFLITAVLLRARESKSGLRNFYLRRLLRIVPLYYLMLFVFLTVVPRFAELERYDYFWMDREHAGGWSYWLFLSNVQTAVHEGFRHDFLSVTWSLAVEEQFYLIWPWVVLLCRPAFLARLCVGLIFGALALRIALLFAGAHPLTLYVLTPCRMDTLAAGAFLAVLARDPADFRRALPAWRKLAVVSTLGLAGLLAALVLSGQAVTRAGAPSSLVLLENPWMQTLGFSLLTAVFASVLALVVGQRQESKTTLWLRRIPFGFLAKYSFAMYLVHLPALMVAQRLVDPQTSASPWRDQIVLYAVGFAFTLGVAWLCWTVIERPALSLRSYLPSTRPRTLPGAVAGAPPSSAN